jgi:MFS family permease
MHASAFLRNKPKFLSSNEGMHAYSFLFDKQKPPLKKIKISPKSWGVLKFFLEQLLAQCLHAFSFGLFHLIAMKVIFQNFSAEQQGRGQALYSTMWGLGVASGSLLAGHYWQIFSGSTIFLCASIVVLLGLMLVIWLPNQVETTA